MSFVPRRCVALVRFVQPSPDDARHEAGADGEHQHDDDEDDKQFPHYRESR
jgi:hypothetical protein